MVTSREEQRLVEELWTSSARAYEEARRREICVEWIAYHERLADVSRTEQGLPTAISVVRSVSALEDALAMITEDTAEAEEA
jgi:hypothetical protein